MEIRVLGAHNLESRSTRHACYLIDGRLAVDAGSLASSLSLAEQDALSGVLLTHRHFDHIRDIPTLGLARLGVAAPPLTIAGSAETLAGLRRHLLNDDAYPDLFRPLNGAGPSLVEQTLEPGVAAAIDGYTVLPIPMPHAVEATGFVVTSALGEVAGFTGDTGGDLLRFYQGNLRPSVLIVDMTYPSGNEDRAGVTGHLTPTLLEREVGLVHEAGENPVIWASHRDPRSDSRLEAELRGVAQRTGADIRLAWEGITIPVGRRD
jgi:glyoxylase-like metal-dependent hydrolase (beta-lactamase superfamily II)